MLLDAKKCVDRDQAEKLAAYVRKHNPTVEVRVLEDCSVAMKYDLLFTRAIATGVNYDSYTKRFCFEDRERADTEFAMLVGEDIEPTGWIARR